METQKGCAIVTGASRGIGHAIALQLARDGYAVCVNYSKDRERAERVLKEIHSAGGCGIVVQADVSQREEAERLVQEATLRLGKVTLLVNNAGISKQALFQDTDDETWNRILQVNLGGARNMSLAVLPQMLQEKRGNMVNISSMWGFRGASCEVAYACSKAALIALTRSLALELAPSGIRVNCVAPGCIETEMMRELGEETCRLMGEETPMGRLGTPEEVAQIVSFLASEHSSFMTGQVLSADGGLTV